MQIVVGAAIIANKRLLVAQRAGPPALAGLWEFPGGKVEDGETDVAALIRECREELGLEVAVGRRIGSDQPIVDGALVLRLYLACIVGGSLRLVDHLAVRWLGAEELTQVPWIPVDLPLLDPIRRQLTQ